jgi:hypothetical protein
MNGFAGHDLDEDAFGEKASGGSGLRTFDAFRMFDSCYIYFLFVSVFIYYNANKEADSCTLY